MLVKKFMVNKFLICFLIYLFSLNIYAQNQIFEYKRAYSNKLFNDSSFCDLKSKTPLLIATSYRALHKANPEPLSEYFEWGKYETGYSITKWYKENGNPTGINRYYELKYSEFNMFGYWVIAIYYQEEIFFFQLIKQEGEFEDNKVYYFIRI